MHSLKLRSDNWHEWHMVYSFLLKLIKINCVNSFFSSLTPFSQRCYNISIDKMFKFSYYSSKTKTIHFSFKIWLSIHWNASILMCHLFYVVFHCSWFWNFELNNRETCLVAVAAMNIEWVPMKMIMVSASNKSESYCTSLLNC